MISAAPSFLLHGRPTTHSIAFPPVFLIASSRLAPPAKVSSSMPLDVGTVTVCKKLEVLTMRDGSFDVARRAGLMHSVKK